ncbi:ATP-binding protein, partial [Microbispora sp. ZYX-F-249]
FNGEYTHSEDELRDALTLSPRIPIIRTDARDRESVKSTLITLVEHALTSHVGAIR